LRSSKTVNAIAGSGGSRWSLVRKTGSFVLKRLAKFVGSKFIDDLGVFFTEFNDILGGFRKRAEETFALLRQPRVGFVLVASPEPMAVREALAFHERLVGAGMPFVGFVVNKVFVSRPISPGPNRLDAALAAHPGVAALGLSGTTRTMAAQALLAAHTEIETLATGDQRAIAELRTAGGAGALVVQVPLLRDDVHENALGAHYLYGDNQSFLLPRGSIGRSSFDHGLDMHFGFARPL
jgi:anion-transporting  ArsA/GET3 family ATPase